MTELDASLAPGCYGISLLYRKDTPECSTCPFAAQCAPLAQAQLEKLRAEMGIVVVAKQDKRVSSASDPTAAGFTLPVKVQELVDAIERTGIKVGEVLRRGANPFTNKFPFMRVAAFLLLKSQGAGVTRDGVAKAIAQVLKVSNTTADAYALQASHALRAIGVANETGGVLRLRR